MDPELWAALTPALAVGLVLGLLGAGGSILTVPILVYLVHLSPPVAIAAALVVVGITSLIASLQHARDGHVRLRAALVFSLAGIPAAYLGARLSRGLSARVLLLFFALVMVLSALAMLFRRESQEVRVAAPAKLLAVGAAVGLVTGVVGAGGGFLIVPALVLFAGVPAKEAVGTSLVAISLNCAAGLVGKLGSTAIPWLLSLQFTGIAVVGSLLGHAISRRISPGALRRIFAILVLAIAAWLMVKNL